MVAADRPQESDVVPVSETTGFFVDLEALGALISPSALENKCVPEKKVVAPFESFGDRDQRAKIAPKFWT